MTSTFNSAHVLASSVSAHRDQQAMQDGSIGGHVACHGGSSCMHQALKVEECPAGAHQPIAKDLSPTSTAGTPPRSIQSRRHSSTSYFCHCNGHEALEHTLNSLKQVVGLQKYCCRAVTVATGPTQGSTTAQPAGQPNQSSAAAESYMAGTADMTREYQRVQGQVRGPAQE